MAAQSSSAQSCETDVAILGAHLAGGVLAAALARAGVTVALLDAGRVAGQPAGDTTVPYTTAVVQLIAERFDVPELAALAHFPDLPPAVRRASGVKKSLGFLYHRPGRDQDPRETVQFNVPGEHNEWHLSRPEVDEHAVDIARSQGALLLSGRPRAVKVALDADGVTVVAEDGSTVRARYLVDAAGPESPLLEQLGLDGTVGVGGSGTAEAAVRPPRSRVLTTRMRGVKPFEECTPLSAYRHVTPWTEGTVHHLFDGGWLQLVPFGNHPEGEERPLCGVTLSLDSDRQDLPEDPEEAFRTLVDRYPSLRRQFAGAEAAEPWTGDDPWPRSVPVRHGARWVALERSTGRFEEFLSRDVTVAFESVFCVATAVLRTVQDGADAAEQFAAAARFQDDLNAFNDAMLAAARTACADFRLWNAYSRVWLLWQILAHLSLKRARLDCADGDWSAVEKFGDGGLWFRTPAGLRELLDWFFAEFERVRAGTLDPRRAADEIFRELGRARFAPPLYKFADPAARVYRFTKGRRLLMLAWVKTVAPADFRRLLTMDNVTGRRGDGPS